MVELEGRAGKLGAGAAPHRQGPVIPLARILDEGGPDRHDAGQSVAAMQAAQRIRESRYGRGDHRELEQGSRCGGAASEKAGKCFHPDSDILYHSLWQSRLINQLMSCFGRLIGIFATTPKAPG
jgi:hypothetical protein